MDKDKMLILAELLAAAAGKGFQPTLPKALAVPDTHTELAHGEYWDTLGLDMRTALQRGLHVVGYRLGWRDW